MVGRPSVDSSKDIAVDGDCCGYCLWLSERISGGNFASKVNGEGNLSLREYNRAGSLRLFTSFVFAVFYD